MAEFRGGDGEVNARIVYWGIEGAGKLTNLRVIHSKLRPDHRGDLRQLPTRLDPTVTYALLPIELGQVGGVRTRIQIVAVPGGADQAVTRKQLLDQVDGVVFVVDTSRERIDDNLASFEELRSALAAYGRALEQVPLVIQYNKRDREDPYALEELHRKLSLRGVAAFEAAAAQGTAVLQTLTTISKRVIRHLREQGEAGGGEVEGLAAPPGEPPRPRAPAETASPTRVISVDTTAPGRRPPLQPAHPAEADAERERAIAETTARAEALFEPSFEGAAALVQEAVGAAGAAPAGELTIDTVGQPRATGPHAVRLPLVLRDAEGRRLAVSLTVHVDVRAEETGD